MNNTTIVSVHQMNDFHHVQVALLSIMLSACLLGNILVITAILKTKKLKIPSNFLIVNLSVCDMLTAVCAIPFTGIVYNIFHGSMSFPYGAIGCKLLWPITTYASNASVFTLATIAVERYLNIASFNIKLSKKRYVIVVSIIHALAITIVIPYIVVLKYAVYDNKGYCYETWSIWHMKAYTISLFIIQYALPLLIMAIFYLLAWWTLYTHNKEMIKMTEEYERKMDWQVPYRKLSRKDGNLSDDPSTRNTSIASSTLDKDVISTPRMSNIERKLLKRKESVYKAPQRKSVDLTNIERKILNRRESLQFNRRESVNMNRRESLAHRRESLAHRRESLAHRRESLAHRRESLHTKRRESLQMNRRESLQMNRRESLQMNRRESVQMKRKQSVYKAPYNSSMDSVASNSPSYERRILRRKNPVEEPLCKSSPTTTRKYQGRSQSGEEGSIVTIQKETYQRKVSTVRTSRRSRVSMQEARRFNKSRYSSQTAYIRHRQSVRTLKMFTLVVIVFACFALPNQVSWLLNDFSGISQTTSYIFVLLTYVSSVMNCWIYGGFHSGIRKAYINIICCSSDSDTVFSRPRSKSNTSRTTRTSISSTSLYNSIQEELFRRRMSSFNHMFEDYSENFDNIKHLHQFADDLDEESEHPEEDEFSDARLDSFDNFNRLYRHDDIDEESENMDDEYSKFLDGS